MNDLPDPLVSRARRVVVALLVVVLASAGSIAVARGAYADDTGSNGTPVNTAIVENTTDNSSVFKLAFQIREIQNAENVQPGNAAISIASCSNCQTVSIAVQVIFVVGSPDVFAPENAAVAVNAGCSFCDTLATAYQFVVQSAVPVHLTAQGRQQIHDIYTALRDLDGSGLTAVEIQARVDDLMKQLATVLATEVEPVPGDPQRDNHDVQVTTTTTQSTTSTTPSTSTTTSSSTTTTTIASSSSSA